ncbi:MAG: methyltransferase domain-containing protein [Gordonia sp. (in: high G+C Gram-positive bacteria)]
MNGHRFDVARQGYVALLAGRSAGLSSDTADMVAARRVALDSGPYRVLRSTLAGIVVEHLPADPPLIVDAGCGTGQYLASCLDALPAARGLGLDLSKFAARAAARCHPRAAAVVADLWQPWPVGDDSAAAVLAVFAPRGFAEARRVLVDDGVLVVVTPCPDHLAELRGPLGMLDVEADKHDKLVAALAEAGFTTPTATAVTTVDEWSAADIAAAVAMGPSGFHTTPAETNERARRLVGDGGTVPVTLSVDVTVARRTAAPPALG